jgi:poly-gamma-glutamate synthesis protein (capsule biosynthesis protein)
MASFLEMPKGRIALVGMHTDTTGRLGATRRTGSAGGRAGLSALRLTTYHEVTAEQLEALRKVRNAIHTPPPGMSNPLPLPTGEPADRLQLLDTWYQAGSRPGFKHYVMDQSDLRDITRNIRNGKQYADFMIATIHAHQGPWVSQKWAHEDETPDFLIELAHASIENGADAFVGHGPHVLRGIEIYRGKPVFYGLGEFFRQSDWRIVGSSGGASELTNAEIAKQDMDRRDVRAPIMYESLIALSRYDQARLVEVVLYPIDTRFDGPLSWVGIPRPAPPQTARRILERLQALSKPFGTTIAIEGNVGVIRIGAATRTSGGRQPQ